MAKQRTVKVRASLRKDSAGEIPPRERQVPPRAQRVSEATDPHLVKKLDATGVPIGPSVVSYSLKEC